MSAFDKLGLAKASGNVMIGGVADGFEAFVIARISQEISPKGALIHVVRDGNHLNDLEAILKFVDPELPVLTFPGWDCLPYDRVSPSGDVSAKRLSALTRFLAFNSNPHRAVILTTVNAITQMLPPRNVLDGQGFSAKPGNSIDMNALARRLENGGFDHVPTVRDVGEFALRGRHHGHFCAGEREPVRLDFFGDTLESIRSFDPATQRTTGQRKGFDLAPMSEVALTPETVSRFRTRYIQNFGAARRDDALYAAVSEQRRFAGMEHWLPLYYDKLETLFDYLPDAPVVFEHLVNESIGERHTQVLDHFEARKRQSDGKEAGESLPYMPFAPLDFYMDANRVRHALGSRKLIELSAFHSPATSTRLTLDAGSARGRTFASERQDNASSVFDAAVDHIGNLRKAGRKVLLSAWSEGSLDRLLQVLTEHELGNIETVSEFRMVKALSRDKVTASVLPIENGFETSDLVVVTEQDILGDRLIRRSKRSKRSSDVITEATGLAAGDIVVHVDHGIGRFVGLRTIEAAGAPHDCLELRYAGDDRLFLPVENIELLSRYGGEGTEATLDKLGGGGMAGTQGKAQEAASRYGWPAYSHCRRATVAPCACTDAAGWPLRRVRCPVPIRGNRRPDDGYRKCCG